MSIAAQLTTATALELAQLAARAAQLDPRDAVVMRERVEIMIALPRADAIARVAPPHRTPIAARMVAMANAYARVGAPTVRLIGPELQPLIEARGTVTLWQRLDGPTADEHAYEQIGALIRRVHDAAGVLVDEPELPPLDPFVEIDLMLAALDGDGYDRQRLASLRARRHELGARWQSATDDPLGRALVHGDVHHENVMMTGDGPMLVDLEMGGVGPAIWDFAVLAAAEHRYAAPPDRLDAFVRGYGVDPRGSEALARCRDVYELSSAVWAARCRRQSAQLAREAELRVTSLLFDDQRAAWTLL